jgi:hypothetical protein
LLAAAGVIGFIGNEIAAQVRLRAGRKLHSPALVADGNHARVDGFVSIGVVASAAVVSLGLPIADPLIGLVITLVILKITWDSWWTVQAAPEHHLEPSYSLRASVGPDATGRVLSADLGPHQNRGGGKGDASGARRIADRRTNASHSSPATRARDRPLSTRLASQSG